MNAISLPRCLLSPSPASAFACSTSSCRRLELQSKSQSPPNHEPPLTEMHLELNRSKSLCSTSKELIWGANITGRLLLSPVCCAALPLQERSGAHAALMLHTMPCNVYPLGARKGTSVLKQAAKSPKRNQHKWWIVENKK